MLANKSIRRRSAPLEAQQLLPATVHPVLRRVYAARDIGADQVDLSLRRMLPVGRFAGAVAGAGRLADSRARDERILVVGDFDADGATATALTVSSLRAFGFPAVDYLVPDRFRFGYGLSPAIVEYAAERRPDLIITVDNGVSSRSGVDRARELGMRVIITDHHLAGAALPAADEIVNPNLPNEEFAGKSLAGVGVAFYLVAALGRELAARGFIDADTAQSVPAAGLDLVALGTVADLVPLDYNNRVLVSAGLRRIRAGQARPGIRALFDVAGRNPARARSSDLGFGIAPRLNAAGRLTDMSLGIECLMAQSVDRARPLAARLDTLNQERRALQARMESEAGLHLAAAQDAVEREPAPAYCLFDPGWHEGVVGLVASRLKDRSRRPVVAFARSETAGLLKGSARSIDGIHIRDVIDRIAVAEPALVTRFGGHAMAAGLSLEESKLAQFRAAFQHEIGQFDDALSRPDVIWSDGALAPGDLSLELAEALTAASPWGQGFPEPVFDDELEIVSLRLLKDRHLKLSLRHPDASRAIDAIAFNQPELPGGGQAAVRFCYRLDVNEFRQERRAQLVVEHMQCD
ncbi:MAG: single-stranded-DNA-specific exonuclease RecJ [Gammaproteobacteria bacterium]|nr:single-stranded-DNA-specific exonuclease RecJ [Gammaproteobacteria bacterium]